MPDVVDYTDPCAVLAILRPAYFKLLAGGVVRVKIGDEEVQRVVSTTELFNEIMRLERLCAIKQGKVVRAAIGSSYQRREG